MAYNERLEQLIAAATSSWTDMTKKKMFGGVCYLLKGTMCFGIYKDFLIVRMEKDEAEKSLKNKSVRPFDITGRPMSGWVMVEESGWNKNVGLKKWLETGKKFALTLPEKKPKKKENAASWFSSLGSSLPRPALPAHSRQYRCRGRSSR